MDIQQASDLLRDTIWTSLVLSAPVLLTALITGLVISVFQAATQVNEQTLSFVPKIMLTLGVFALTFPVLMSTLVSFTRRLMERVASGSLP